MLGTIVYMAQELLVLQSRALKMTDRVSLVSALQRTSDLTSTADLFFSLVGANWGDNISFNILALYPKAL